MNTAPLNGTALNGSAPFSTAGMTFIESLVEAVAATDALDAALELGVELVSGVVGGSNLTVALTLVAEVRASAHVADPLSAGAVLQALLVSTVEGRTTTPFAEDASSAWVVNLESGGSTRYEQYPFNSFACINGAYYGARADGIYRLDGVDDAGLPVQAMVSFGKQDFGTTAMKRVTNAYLGAASTGKLFLKVLADGADYTYAARSSAEHLMTQRVDIGRGLRANLVEFELYNANGDDFELASVEFLAMPLTRRI